MEMSNTVDLVFKNLKQPFKNSCILSVHICDYLPKYYKDSRLVQSLWLLRKQIKKSLIVGCNRAGCQTLTSQVLTASIDLSLLYLLIYSLIR